MQCVVSCRGSRLSSLINSALTWAASRRGDRREGSNGKGLATACDENVPESRVRVGVLATLGNERANSCAVLLYARKSV